MTRILALKMKRRALLVTKHVYIKILSERQRIPTYQSIPASGKLTMLRAIVTLTNAWLRGYGGNCTPILLAKDGYWDSFNIELKVVSSRFFTQRSFVK